jgi:hypothetical protein
LVKRGSHSVPGMICDQKLAFIVKGSTTTDGERLPLKKQEPNYPWNFHVVLDDVETRITLLAGRDVERRAAKANVTLQRSS